MDARQQSAIHGAACAPLSREQKRDICMLAERAWHVLGRPMWEPMRDPELALSRTAALELWRHMEQEHLLGRKHLTQCGQADYLLLKAHFSRLAGCHGVAKAAEARMTGDNERRARAVLRRELFHAKSQLADPTRYAETIARSKYKTGLSGLTARQVWTIIFDLRRSVWARKKKQAGTASGTSAAMPMEKAPF